MRRTEIRPLWLANVIRDLRPEVLGTDVRSNQAEGFAATPNLPVLDDPPQSPLETSLVHLLARGGSDQLESDTAANLALSAKRLIDSSYADFLTVGKIASNLGCHHAHLTRSFKAEWGIPPSAYLRMVRVGASLQLLTQSNVKISAIPLIVGFRGKGAFYKAVKAVIRCTPAEYRSRINILRGEARSGSPGAKACVKT